MATVRKPPLVDRFRPVDLDRDWSALRQTGPAVQVPCADGAAWLLTRYEDVRSVLASQDFSIAPIAEVAGQQPRNGSIFQDPPGHTRLRRLISPAFAARRVELLRRSINANASRLVAVTKDQGVPFDFMRAIAYPLTMDAISEIVGIPQADRASYLRLAADVLVPNEGAARETIIQRCEGLNDYIRTLLKRRRQEQARGTDVIGILLAASAEGHINEQEMTQLVFGLPIAGYVSTTNALALAVHYIVEESWAPRLRSSPALIARWVEELLRMQSGDNGESMPRYAKKDLHLGPVKIAKGDMVVAPLVAANRDAAFFPDPLAFNPCRASGSHLAFGAGIHRCIGAPLARVELQCAVRAIVSAGAELAGVHSENAEGWGSNIFGDIFPQEVMLRWTSAPVPPPEVTPT